MTVVARLKTTENSQGSRIVCDRTFIMRAQRLEYGTDHLFLDFIFFYNFSVYRSSASEAGNIDRFIHEIRIPHLLCTFDMIWNLAWDGYLGDSRARLSANNICSKQALSPLVAACYFNTNTSERWEELLPPTLQRKEGTTYYYTAIKINKQYWIQSTPLDFFRFSVG